MDFEMLKALPAGRKLDREVSKAIGYEVVTDEKGWVYVVFPEGDKAFWGQGEWRVEAAERHLVEAYTLKYSTVVEHALKMPLADNYYWTLYPATNTDKTASACLKNSIGGRGYLQFSDDGNLALAMVRAWLEMRSKEYEPA